MAGEFAFVRPNGHVVEVRVSDLDDGDFHIDRPEAALLERRARIMPGPWAVVRQVHGNRVVEAEGM